MTPFLFRSDDFSFSPPYFLAFPRSAVQANPKCWGQIKEMASLAWNNTNFAILKKVLSRNVTSAFIWNHFHSDRTTFSFSRLTRRLRLACPAFYPKCWVQITKTASLAWNNANFAILKKVLSRNVTPAFIWHYFYSDRTTFYFHHRTYGLPSVGRPKLTPSAGAKSRKSLVWHEIVRILQFCKKFHGETISELSIAMVFIVVCALVK